MTEGLKTTSHQSVYIDSPLPCPVALRGVAEQYRGDTEETPFLRRGVKKDHIGFFECKSGVA